jgi:hypothetical protein
MFQSIIQSDKVSSKEIKGILIFSNNRAPEKFKGLNLQYKLKVEMESSRRHM